MKIDKVTFINFILIPLVKCIVFNKMKPLFQILEFFVRFMLADLFLYIFSFIYNCF